MFKTTFAILKKDLVDAVVNLRLLASIVMPILMSLLFGSLFGGLQDSDVPPGMVSVPGPAVIVPVYDAGESHIVRLLDASEAFDVRQVASPAAVQRALTRERLSAGLILPEGFDAALVEGSQPTAQLMLNAGQGDGGEALRAWLTHALWERAGQPFPSGVTVETLPLQEKHPVNQRQENMALWLVMSLVTSGVYVVPTLLVEEKQTRTLNAILATPAGYGELVIAKAGVGLIYGLLASGLILGANNGLVANAGLVVLAVLLCALVLVEMGLLLGSLFDDVVTLNTWGTLVMLALMLPGMLYTLLASGLFRLGLLQWIVRLLPTYYFLEIVFAALSGQFIAERVAATLGLLAGLAILLFFLTVGALRRQAR